MMIIAMRAGAVYPASVTAFAADHMAGWKQRSITKPLAGPPVCFVPSYILDCCAITLLCDASRSCICPQCMPGRPYSHTLLYAGNSGTMTALVHPAEAGTAAHNTYSEPQGRDVAGMQPLQRLGQRLH